MNPLGFISDIGKGVMTLIGGQQDRDAQREFNQRSAENAAAQMKMQEEFAKNSVQWRVNDAKAAGIHPLYALGHQGVSYSPVSLGGEAYTGSAATMAAAGQDFSRALEATRTSDQRTEAVGKAAQMLALEKGSLENELLRANIAKLRAQVGPPMPALTDKNAIDGQPATRVLDLPGGIKLVTPANESTQDDVSKEYGDEGLPQLPGQYRFIRDFMKDMNTRLMLWNSANRVRYEGKGSRQFYQR